MAASVPTTAPQSTAAQPLIPPDEKFWERYSPHSEAPLSGVTSTVLHVLAFGLLMLVLFLQSLTAKNDEAPSLPLEPVRIVDHIPVGVGPTPVGGGGGGTNETGDLEDIAKGPKPPEHADITPQAKIGVKKTFQVDEKDADRWINEGTEAIGRLGSLEEDVQGILRKSMTPGKVRVARGVTAAEALEKTPELEAGLARAPAAS